MLLSELDAAISRRAMLQAAVAAAAAQVVPALAGDSIAGGIIDTHTHFYDPTRPEGVPWPSKDDKVLYRPVLPEHYRKLAAPLGITGTVVVEASERLEDNQWVLDLAARDKLLVGLVGHLKPEGQTFAKDLARFSADPLFRGIRIGHSLLKSRLKDKAFLDALAKLQERSRALDVNGGPDMLPDVARLAEALPKLTIVVNHLANVRIDGKTPPEEWRRGMTEAAKHSHVHCKVSAFVEGASRDGKKAPVDPTFYRPVFDVAWDTFGPDRLMFGSNWPISERAAGLATILTIAREEFARRGTEATNKFLAANARRIYGTSAGTR